MIVALTFANRSSAPAPGDPEPASSFTTRPASPDTERQIAQLQEALRAQPGDAQSYALLGNTYYERARETGDSSYYARAEAAFGSALDSDPSNGAAIAGQATLALARHQFGNGLKLARQAVGVARQTASPYFPLADAQIEVGRYEAAARTLNRLVRLKANLAAYARISYYRELHGDLRGALQAMQFAVSAGPGVGEGQAYVQSLLGKLLAEQGRYGAAERAYRAAVAIVPGYPAAIAGLADLEAGAGDFAPAIRRYRRVVERLPLPEYAVALCEVEEAAGRVSAAKRDCALVGAEAKLLRADGVNTDVDLALFEANHGNAARAVTLGRRAWREAPSVRSADAYSWALHAAGRRADAARLSRQAMKLGSRDPSFLYHAGMIAHSAGRAGRARALLGALLRQAPRFSALYAPRARHALRELR
jgi:tetratricopeptide (TPR) repeat protein